ncbi:MAG: M28 family peptidase [Bacteroidetes bacterium]|nr:M28 family peptidase [Bacteroidota bacterium]
MKFFLNVFMIITVVLIVGCNDGQKAKHKSASEKAEKPIKIPDFNKDSAYHFVQMQVDFGPRVPGTKAHTDCAKYLSGTLNRMADTVFVQTFQARAYDGTVLNGKNIIGSFQPEKADRIFLCAHWDSRPFADHDPDIKNHNTPIDGANDGASGVGVLLEIARQISLSKPKVGVDIIFFDLEDYGPPQDSQQKGEGDWWALGSQYWSRNTHIPGYFAKYGILLDMVGAENATFLMEGFSLYYAPGLVKKVWNTAHQIGYSSRFLFEQGGYIEDDHKYVNEILKIPTINIIHLDHQSVNGSFFDHWHTVRDNMETISQETLKIVGQTVLTVVFEE